MAWLKSITKADNGVVANYWELISVHYDHRAQMSKFTYGGWVSYATYADNLAPVITGIVKIPAGSAPELAEGALAFGTAVIRAQEQFEGSENA